jgi:hypothetical protein
MELKGKKGSVQSNSLERSPPLLTYSRAFDAVDFELSDGTRNKRTKVEEKKGKV